MIKAYPKEKDKPKKRKIGRTGLVKKLDAIFSSFVRLRDADNNGLCRCITSGEFVDWKDCDAGHFITRNNMPTRWHEKNVNSQSRKDNRFLSGKQFEHGLAIDRKWGKGTAELLLIKSKYRMSFDVFELEALIEHYQKEVEKLRQQKGL